MNNHKYTLILLALITISFPSLLNASGLVPFGGLVTLTVKCDEGLLLTVMRPLLGPMKIMWLTGELPYLMFRKPHVGQELLGMLGTVPIACTNGPSVEGVGIPIIYHGESY